jgi:5-formyltetrahydrofolate cyclo-ligase
VPEIRFFMTSPSDDSDGLTSDKAALRKITGGRRDQLAAVAPDSAERFKHRFLETWKLSAGTVVSAFWPIRSELDTRPLIQALHDLGCVIALPVVKARLTALEFRQWTPDTRLDVGQFGVSTPPADAAVLEPDWLLVPLLAFDARGYRLGYGGGFYDITLADLRARNKIFAIGAAYDGQEIAAVPRDANDARLDAILTEQRVLIMEP